MEFLKLPNRQDGIAATDVAKAMSVKKERKERKNGDRG
jgi:hypothetical protein